MFDFALLEFPARMKAFKAFSRVQAQGLTRSFGEGTNLIVSTAGDPNKFEYVSDTSYVNVRIRSDHMWLTVYYLGEVVVDASYEDFNELLLTIGSYA